MAEEQEDFERPKLEPKGHAYRLVEDWHTDGKGTLPYVMTIPKGFVTDGASIPRLLWTVCGDPMSNPRIYAAIVHDYIYDVTGSVAVRDADGNTVLLKMTRREADRIYRDYQIALGISRIKAYTEYYALRVAGWTHWEEA